MKVAPHIISHSSLLMYSYVYAMEVEGKNLFTMWKKFQLLDGTQTCEEEMRGEPYVSSKFWEFMKYAWTLFHIIQQYPLGSFLLIKLFLRAGHEMCDCWWQENAFTTHIWMSEARSVLRICLLEWAWHWPYSASMKMFHQFIKQLDINCEIISITNFSVRSKHSHIRK